jgi:hypothetical protein
MRTALLVGLAVCVSFSAACGGSSGNGLPPDSLDHDAASNFAGTWYGTVSASVDGQQQQGTSSMAVEASGRNTLFFSDFCGAGVGPSARVTSDSTFTIGSYSCTVPVTGQSCSVTWQIRSGSGTLVAGTVSLSVDGVASGCGRSNVAMSLAFTGTRNGAYGGYDHGAPTANVSLKTYGTQPGVPVTLDGSGSTDPDGRLLTYAWSVTQQPVGGDAQLVGTSSPQPTFTASTRGDYTVQLVVTASDGQSGSTTATVRVSPPGQAITSLSHRALRAEYSRALDRIVMVDGSPALYVYDPGTGAESKLSLPLPPQCLSLSPDGRYAVVGHNAWISYVELAPIQLLKTIPVSADVGDCVLGGNGWAYLFPRVDQWVALHNVELATGVETTSGSYQLYAGARARLHPDGTRIYSVDVGLYPADLHRWDVSGGAGVYAFDSRYHGDYPMGPNVWYTSDGAVVLTGAGTAFRTDGATRDTDLSYAGRLSGVTQLKHLDACPDEIAAVPDVTDPTTSAADTAVELFNTTYLGHTGRITLPYWAVGGGSYPVHAQFVFHRSDCSQKYVIVQADPTSSLLLDTAVLTY